VGWVGLGFDAADDLWISNAGGHLLKLRSNQLMEKHPSPAILISLMGWFPGLLRFDSSDNLWVDAGNHQLWRFAPGDRAASGPPNPSLKVTVPDELGRTSLAFDKSGNLWLAGSNSHNNELEMISAADLAGSGEISPAAVVTITSPSFGVGPCLGAIDFDHSGDLWVSVVGIDAENGCVADSQVVDFTPDQLAAGGDLTPSVTISQNSTKTNLFIPGPITFGPALK
jgi:hypothetical protein